MDLAFAKSCFLLPSSLLISRFAVCFHLIAYLQYLLALLTNVLAFIAKRAILSCAKEATACHSVKLEQTAKFVTAYNAALIHFSYLKNVIIPHL